MLQSHEYNEALENNICIHIFSVSVGMVGICLTVIGLLRIVFERRQVSSLCPVLASANGATTGCSNSGRPGNTYLCGNLIYRAGVSTKTYCTVINTFTYPEADPARFGLLPRNLCLCCQLSRSRLQVRLSLTVYSVLPEQQRMRGAQENQKG